MDTCGTWSDVVPEESGAPGMGDGGWGGGGWGGVGGSQGLYLFKVCLDEMSYPGVTHWRVVTSPAVPQRHDPPPPSFPLKKKTVF